ncbi:hypothetical protein [Rubrobacter calidifluminis]|uniref:hypothetical protein n=1 Tax=Rubrobacter calidifluminis TaxID=1392640 RepID=UPI002361B418|nr:hypothetical protein [Rubrobacter calidifluminis]
MQRRSEGRKKAIAVCGPTASGKSDLADHLAGMLATNATVVDSMQVYREIPNITNQKRRREANLVGIISVNEEWNVALHREAVRRIEREHPLLVLDAGTGMYLNAVLLEIQLWPRVEEELRERARALARGSDNERRETRKIELSLIGAKAEGSIWKGDLRYDTTLVYLRPDREMLDEMIERRSTRIAREGLEEAEKIYDMVRGGEPVSEQVMGSIGVRELLGVVKGEISREEARRRIAARTRRMARRQIRWFDKLARNLSGEAEVLVAESASEMTERTVPWTGT